MREFTVDRSKWMRGKGDQFSRLLVAPETARNGSTVPSEDVGKMCCLGFYSLACGLTPEEIEDVGFPSSVGYPDEMEWVTFDDRENTIGEINDDPAISDAEREERLTKIFGAYGVRPIFVDQEEGA
jgi:hypothetical protein